MMEKAVGVMIEEIVLKSINKARELNADILGFSEQLHRRNLIAWRRVRRGLAGVLSEC